ncbi:MAG: nucleoside phosphorylase [Deltaproteobacteria bacterium]|nr:nucleoside phosphorylase [Deltaproteobacteria bacterium]
MSCLMNPRREKGEPLLQGPVLLYLNPAEAGRAGRFATKLNAGRHYLFNSNLWELDSDGGSFYVCGPAVGAPMAALVLEKLIALGAKKIIVCGTCGSLRPDLTIGDIILPDSALSAEGVSGHYPLKITPSAADNLLLLLESFLQDISLPWRRGAVCSTDAPYREELAEISKYQQKGICAMDMEFSALLSVAAFRRIDLAAIMVVSDQVHANQWQAGFKTPLFKQRMRIVAGGLIDYFMQGT